jgi:2,3,4,5-tetrahydropyridine-2,6-dicarboxylate N-succinyltransferase
MTETRGASAAGVATLARDRVLDVYYPEPRLGAWGEAGTRRTGQVAYDEIRGVHTVPVETSVASLADPPADAYDAYLRLHLLSHRLIRPHDANLDGLFGMLSNVAWTSHGPVDPAAVPQVQRRLRNAGEAFQVFSVDKFPRMTDYVVPPGVRIADADRVRLGAHLADGTTVMHEGFVNFNAGTLGHSMVEGRISAGVVVGDGSDVGDDCVVEAGLYLTAGARVALPDGEVVKARELSGASGLLFRRNSQSGAIEVVPRTGTWGGLNAALHANQ